MKADNNSHYLIYRVLGISNNEGSLIDEYQNTERFLYKYAGSFLEEAASLCLFFANSKGVPLSDVSYDGMVILQAPSLQIAKCLNKQELTKPSTQTAKICAVRKPCAIVLK